MSASEKPKSNNSKLDNSAEPQKPQTNTLDNTLQTESEIISVNEYRLPEGNDSELKEIAKSTTTFDLDTSRSTGTFVGSIESPTSASSGNKGSDSFDEFAGNSTGKSYNSLSHELEESKSMDVRKVGGNAKSNSELERKKLEAELKATEEIAKIKQSVIEKRLALELASISNNQFTHKSKHSQPDLRALEEMAVRKQALIESNLAQEITNLEYQHQYPSPRVQHTMAISQPHPPLPTQPQMTAPTRQSEAEIRNTSNYSETGFLNSESEFRSTKRVDSRSAGLDRRISGPEFRNTPPAPDFMTNRTTDMRFAQGPDLGAQRFPPQINERPVAYPGSVSGQVAINPPVIHDFKGRSIWKNFFGKLKKTFKGSKNPETWQ